MDKENKGCLITLSAIFITGIISGLVTDIYTGFGIILLLCFIVGFGYFLVIGCSGKNETIDRIMNRRNPKR